MAHQKVHVICENLCLEEGMTKEDILERFEMLNIIYELTDEDLNDIFNVNRHYVANANNMVLNQPSNISSSAGFNLEVKRCGRTGSGRESYMQVLYSGGGIYTRYYNGLGWSDWRLARIEDI